MPKNKVIFFMCFALMAAACTTTGVNLRSGGRYGSSSVSSKGATYKIGSPYQVNGIWYYPKEDYSYSEVGTASWYGPQFHNKLTANGEIFDMHGLTAAHPTLPLPTMVKVTNLQNGRSIVLKVNDRGPFANDRIIDISKKGAQLLGFLEQGTAKVRVEVLPEESIALKNSLLASEGRGNLGSMAGGAIPNETSNNVPKPIITPLPGATNDPLAPQQTSYAEDRYGIWDNSQNLNSNLNTEVKRTAMPEPTPATPSVTAPKSFNKTSYAQAAVTSGTMVQVGAFSSYENAQKLTQHLSQVGSAFITDVDINGQKLYRVRLNALNEADAQNIINKLSSLGHHGARIIKE